VPPGDEPHRSGPPSRGRVFLAGALGLPVSLAGAALLEALLRAAGSEGSARELIFAGVAGLTPVVALGMLVQLLTSLTGRTRLLLREVRRFDEEMSSDEPSFHEESHVDRMVVWATTRRFVQAVVPFGAGVVTQLVVTEAAAVACLLGEVDDRAAALALCIEVLALFVYLIFFNAILARLSAPPVRRQVEN
jgi:hypothetical protein